MAEIYYSVSDQGSTDTGLSYSEAVVRIREWYEDVDTWGDGHGDAETHHAVAEAISGVTAPPKEGELSDLEPYAEDIRQAVAYAMGSREFAGHGNYYVSAADQCGLGLRVFEDENND